MKLTVLEALASRVPHNLAISRMGSAYYSATTTASTNVGMTTVSGTTYMSHTRSTASWFHA